MTFRGPSCLIFYRRTFCLMLFSFGYLLFFLVARLGMMCCRFDRVPYFTQISFI